MLRILKIAGFVLAAGLFNPQMAAAKDNPSPEQIAKAFKEGKKIVITRRGDYSELKRQYHSPAPPYSPYYPLGYYPPGYYYDSPRGVYIYRGRPRRFDDPSEAAGHITGKIYNNR